jgi:hypothetical protein
MFGYNHKEKKFIRRCVCMFDMQILVLTSRKGGGRQTINVQTFQSIVLT